MKTKSLSPSFLHEFFREYLNHYMGLETHYLFDPEAKKDYQVTIDHENGHFCRESDSNIADPKGLSIYVADKRGQLYVDSSGKVNHHSYFLSGKPTGASGMMYIAPKTKKLIWLDNSSGHHPMPLSDMGPFLRKLYKKLDPATRDQIVFFDWSHHPEEGKVKAYYLKNIVPLRAGDKVRAEKPDAVYSVTFNSNKKGFALWTQVLPTNKHVNMIPGQLETVQTVRAVLGDRSNGQGVSASDKKKTRSYTSDEDSYEKPACAVMSDENILPLLQVNATPHGVNTGVEKQTYLARTRVGFGATVTRVGAAPKVEKATLGAFISAAVMVGALTQLSEEDTIQEFETGKDRFTNVNKNVVSELIRSNPFVTRMMTVSDESKNEEKHAFVTSIFGRAFS